MHGKQKILVGLLCLLARPAMTVAQDFNRDIEALKRKNEQLINELKAQEGRTRQLQSELELSRATITQAKFQIDALERQCKKLQDDLLLAKRVRANGESGEVEKSDGASPLKPRNGRIAGKVTALGKDGRLLQLSVGLENGIKEGQTLEVFRLAPAQGSQRSLYLGTVTLIRVDPQASLGQFKSVTGFEYRPAVGDEVSSELSAK